ncbi:MAG: hypothetical protein H7145_24805 [Akkermansiaceae bacterium]|nr:hypothetical protein [Armatimonadota bacterium]
MIKIRKRYTTVDGKNDWIVSATYDETKLDTMHWFETRIKAVNEKTGKEYPLPPEIALYRIGEIEHAFRDYVKVDFGGDREAAISHFMNTIYRRVYSFIERGH